MWSPRNLAVFGLWTLVIAGAYLGWIVLAVLFAFRHADSVSASELMHSIRGAATPWLVLMPPLIAGHGVRHGYLPGFRRNGAS